VGGGWLEGDGTPQVMSQKLHLISCVSSTASAIGPHLR
jgi:hypothetical protein